MHTKISLLVVLLFALCALAMSKSVLAQHQDVIAEVDSSTIEILNGIDTPDDGHLYQTDFGELGTPFGTDDPGFNIASGNFDPGEILAYTAFGELSYWDGSNWSNFVPDGERVIITDVLGSQTFVSTSGVTNASGFVDAADSTGGIHTHMDFEVENSLGAGDPATGAYLIQFTLFGLANDQVTQVYTDSAPVQIAFNLGLTENEFDQAVDALLIFPDTDNDQVRDNIDNCLLVQNPNQSDTDGDGYGNACDPDFDNSCVVNFVDYSPLLMNVFSTSAPLYDLDSNGVVNFLDLAIFAAFFLQPPGPSALSDACN